MADEPKCMVQCSTGSLAPLAGGRYWNVEAMIRGIHRLGWPAMELRLWQEWDEGDMVQVARRVRDAGAEVNSVHIPPETETLLSTPGHGRDAVDLMDKCLSAALAAGARVAVVHAWDLRCPEFSQSCLIEGLNRFGQSFGDRGISLSVENIPGQLRMLGIIADSCAQVSFTADTCWAAMEDSWGLLSDLIPRLTNVHVQTYVDPLEAGGVTLGRTGTGLGAKSFHAERVMRSFAEGGYSGLVTLEPNNVQNIDETHLRQALEMLSRWCGR